MPVSDRSRSIESLRKLLASQQNPKTSLCMSMSRCGMYCRGFSAWDDAELRQRFHWFCLSRPNIERDELEALADRWQLAEQTSRGLSVPCDIGPTAPSGRRPCSGWSRFTDDELEGFIRQLEASESDS